MFRLGFAFALGATAKPLAGERDLTQYAHTDYLQEFSKSYSDEELVRRKKIFEENLQRIHEHNADPSKTWFATVNEFTDWTNAEFREKRMGKIPELEEHSVWGEHVPVLGGLPTDVDWRTKPGVVTPPKDQGGCGSCWAFSTAETLESHLSIATGEPAPVLSPQQLVSCAPNPNHCGGTGGCSGSIQTLGFNYTKGSGITTEASYPYEGRTGTCDSAKIKPVATNDGYIKLKTNDYDSLVSAVATKGPIAISLAAGSFGWQLYGGGILTKCDYVQDHAVQLVGYGVDGDKDYWLVRNSWGGSWGEHGYIRIQRFGSGKEPCGVDDKPQDGEACEGDTKPRTYCGMCGIMGSSSYPTGMKKTSQPDPNGLGCSLCEKAVAAGVDKGTQLCEQACSQAGSLASICKTACDAIGEVCEKLAHEDCPDAVCKKVGLCSTSGSVIV